MNHNHSNYEKRLAFIRTLFEQRFQLNTLSIVAVAYEEDCPFKYNNFVYKITLPSHSRLQISSTQPGCTPVPDSMKAFILRLANRDAESIKAPNRIENEVATISLVSTALSHVEPSVVPSVYAWENAAATDSQGWILQELMPGVQLDTVFEKLPVEQKRMIFQQMAHFLSGIQKLELPEGVTQLGGLSFDSNGSIVSSRMIIDNAGPWPSFEAYFKERLNTALSEVDNNPYIKGWRPNGVRGRLEAFIEKCLPAQFQHLEGREDKVVVHGDLTVNNLLYDPESNRVTAILDYDFACISHPSREFFHSFSGNGGEFGGWSGDEDDKQTKMRHAKLHGFPTPLPKFTDDVDWEMAEAWEDELEKLQVRRPRTIGGIEKVADVNAILQGIAPWRLTNSDILERQSEEVKVHFRGQCEQRLIDMLGRFGF